MQIWIRIPRFGLRAFKGGGLFGIIFFFIKLKENEELTNYLKQIKRSYIHKFITKTCKKFAFVQGNRDIK